MRLIVMGLCVPALAGCARTGTRTKLASLIPRQVLFGNPDRSSPKISPDGSKLAFLAPVDGVLNVWVGPLADPSAARPVTKDSHRGVRIYFWAYTNSHVVYLQDRGGDENWRAYCVDLDTGRDRDLTPSAGVKVQIQEVSHKHPYEILVGLNDRNPQLHDLYRVNLRTGDKSLVLENEGYAGFATDDDFAVRVASRITPDGGNELFLRKGDAWEPFSTIPRDDMMTTGLIGFDHTGRTLYMRDSRGRNTGALVGVDLDSGTTTLLAEDPLADVGAVLRHPTEKTVQAVGANYLRQRWQFLDLRVSADFEALRSVADGDVDVVSRTLDDQHWIAALTVDDGPVRYYHYDRNTRKAQFLFTSRGSLEGYTLARMHPVVIRSRDELDLVSYLTLPPGTDRDGDGRPNRRQPMVLMVHGGPWARDYWGYNRYHQWLANRGYAVLSVNFRGSTGFGKQFVNAGDLEWAGKMHDDLVDAVNWAVQEKIADRDRVAIMGGSYGGYATLVGLTFTPEVFACGVDIVGPSNIITLFESIPEYWKPIVDIFTARVGDHRTDKGRALLLERSPLSRVDQIRRPLLIGQGANDPRVKQAEADQIVQAMQGKGIPVTYVLFPDEGHGFARPPNDMSFNAVAEAFLAEHLGGAAEPIGQDFEGSSITVPAGADQIEGLRGVLQAGSAEPGASK
ncbi:MAG: S9 family peptidase [bacterium]|nr:S9 family peptidase [bacterium]